MRYPARSPLLLSLGAILVAVLLAVLLWAVWLGPRHNANSIPAEPPSTASAEATGDETPDAAAVEPETAGQPVAPAQPGPADREVSTTGQSSAPDAAQPEAPSAEQLVVQRQVESEILAALGGDQNQAIELSSFLNQCQFTFRDRSRVESSIARAERSFAEGKPLTQFRPTSPAQRFDTLEAFESNQWHTIFRCEAARKLVTDDFWANLEQQADNGNPVARYLFATMMRNPPSEVAAFESWDEELELNEQSRGYTWSNLEDREPLGLLALVQLNQFGLSMRGMGPSTNSVMLLAAVKCGLSTPDLLELVDQTLQRAERLEATQPGALERLNTASDEARRMFCK